MRSLVYNFYNCKDDVYLERGCESSEHAFIHPIYYSFMITSIMESVYNFESSHIPLYIEPDGHTAYSISNERFMKKSEQILL